VSKMNQYDELHESAEAWAERIAFKNAGLRR